MPPAHKNRMTTFSYMKLHFASRMEVVLLILAGGFCSLVESSAASTSSATRRRQYTIHYQSQSMSARTVCLGLRCRSVFSNVVKFYDARARCVLPAVITEVLSFTPKQTLPPALLEFVDTKTVTMWTLEVHSIHHLTGEKDSRSPLPQGGRMSRKG
jgi:hypothetical protein